MKIYSEIGIINNVLSKFAETPVSTAAGSKNSKILQAAIAHYLPLFIKATLDWDFLTKDVILDTPVEGVTTPLWNYALLLPSDSLRVLEVKGLEDFSIRDPYIYSAAPRLTITYLSNSVDYSSFPSHFVEYFVYFLAARYVIPLTRDSMLKKSIDTGLEEVMREAQATEMRQRSGYRTLLNPRSKMINRIA